eukprot:10087616-Ditylum_brightwellii.AAC.2
MGSKMKEKVHSCSGCCYHGVLTEDFNLKHYISAHFNINVETGVLHMGMDMVDHIQNLWFWMVPGFHIIYSAHILTHKQKVRQQVIDENINISAYTSKRFVHNLAKSYEHIMKGKYDSGHKDITSRNDKDTDNNKTS